MFTRERFGSLIKRSLFGQLRKRGPNAMARGSISHFTNSMYRKIALRWRFNWTQVLLVRNVALMRYQCSTPSVKNYYDQHDRHLHQLYVLYRYLGAARSGRWGLLFLGNVPAHVYSSARRPAFNRVATPLSNKHDSIHSLACARLKVRANRGPDHAFVCSNF